MRFLKVLLVVISITFTTSISLFAKEKRSSVAVVVDKTTYKTISQEIDNYIESINAQGKKGLLVIDSCGTPEPIKTTLQKLWREQNLEGAILIGDIPIPMVRNANHLSTGFKMSPKRPWIESSIPSDRYYDDFNLKFTFLKRDSLNKSLFYYSLDADSPQKIDCTIYTSRIKPPKIEGMDTYQAISLYLKKAYNLKAKGAKELQTQLRLGVQAAQAAYEIAANKYNAGLGDFFDVLDAQRQLQTLDEARVISEGAISRQQVALYKALCGGWEGDDTLPASALFGPLATDEPLIAPLAAQAEEQAE